MRLLQLLALINAVMASGYAAHGDGITACAMYAIGSIAAFIDYWVHGSISPEKK